jgi:hypothetical protein
MATIKQVALNFSGSDHWGNPEFITISSDLKSRHHKLDDDPVDWDQKTDVVVWFEMETTLAAMLDYSKTASGDVFDGQLLSNYDSVIVKLKGPSVTRQPSLDDDDKITFTGGEVVVELNDDETYKCECLVGYPLTAADILAAPDTANRWVFPKVPIHYTQDGTLTYLHKSAKWGELCFENFCVSAEVDVEEHYNDKDELTEIYTLRLHGEGG